MAMERAEKLKKIEEKMAQLKAQKQAILAREKQIDRKKRNHRLIQFGALSEKYFDCKDIEPQEFELLLKTIVSISSVKEILNEKTNRKDVGKLIDKQMG